MANKRLSSKRGKRASTPAKRARDLGPRGRKKRWPGPIPRDWLLLALIGLSLAIRLWGIHDRLPDTSLGINVLDDSVVEETDRTTIGRSWTMWRGGTKPLDLNPHTGGWPALSFYLTLAIQYLYKAWYSYRSGGVSPAEFQQHIAAAGSTPLFLFARIVGALIGVVTVYLTYRIGAALLGRRVGLMAGLLVATNTLHILISQHVSDPNLLALLFVLLATEPMIRIAAGGGRRDSILGGAMIGLAGACKYVPLVLALPFAVAHRAGAEARQASAEAKRAGGRETKEDADDRAKRTPFFRNPSLWAGLIAILVAVLVASPFLFLDWKRTLTDIAGQRRALFSDWVGQTVFPFSLPTYLAVSLPHAMGWPAYLLALFGMVLLWRQGRLTRILVWIPAMILLVNGMLKSPQERYVLVAVPYLHIGTALTIIRGVEWARARSWAAHARLAPGAVAFALLAGLSVGWPLPDLLATRRSLSLPDTRHLSRRWIQQNLDPRRPTVLELYGPVFTDAERAILIWPFFATQSQFARVAYHPEFLDGLEYHVASREISRRFEAEPAKYPVENSYYRWLREHAPVVWESDTRGVSGPHIVVRRLPKHISTRAQRDSIFAAWMPRPTRVNRVELWCADASKLFVKIGEYDRAEEWARRGLKVGVESMEPQLRAELGMSLWRLGRLDSAEVETRLAVKGAPRSATVHVYHAAVLADMGRAEEALVEFRKGLELSGENPRLRLSIAQTLAQLGRFEEAVQELQQVPPGHSDRALALRDAAVLLLNHLHRPAEALDLLRESIRLDPNQDQADLMRQQIAQLEAAAGGNRSEASGQPH